MKPDITKILTIVADISTILFVLLIPIYGLINKKKSVIGFKINLAMVYLFKCAIIVLIGIFIFHFSDKIYLLILVILKGETNVIYWEKGQELKHILSYFISVAIGLVMLWFISKKIWNFSLKIFLTQIGVSDYFEKIVTPKLIIEKAIYGTNVSKPYDVTPHVRKMVKDGTLKIQFTNNLAGDPKEYVEKEATLKYRFDEGEIKEIKVKEFDTVEILGLNKYKIIPGKYSLRDSKK